jgi:hypothetical protein
MLECIKKEYDIGLMEHFMRWKNGCCSKSEGAYKKNIRCMEGNDVSHTGVGVDIGIGVEPLAVSVFSTPTPTR